MSLLRKELEHLISTGRYETWKEFFNAEMEKEYFHDTGHIEYENGAHVFTSLFDKVVQTWRTENE